MFRSTASTPSHKEAIMAKKPSSKDNHGSGKSDPAAPSGAAAAEYKVGPGRPPKEFQFPPGVSGNPEGAKHKSPPIALDLKEALERALDKKVQIKQGERERTVTMAVAGIEQLVAQFAKGDPRARRDVFAYADKLGVDLIARTKAREEPFASNHQAILDGFIDRQYDKVVQREAVLAPPELLDDDDDESRS
jgi:hypothetical protein